MMKCLRVVSYVALFSTLLFSCSGKDDIEGVWYNKDGALYLYDNSKGYTPLSPKDTFNYEILGDTLFTMKSKSDSVALKFRMIHRDTIELGGELLFRGHLKKLESKFYAILINQKIGFFSFSDDQLIMNDETEYDLDFLFGQGEYLTFEAGNGLMVCSLFKNMSIMPLDSIARNNLLDLNKNNKNNKEELILLDISDFRITDTGSDFKGSNYLNEKKSDGWYITWHKNGRRLFQGIRINNKKYGYHSKWNSRGDLISHEYYWDDLRNGLSIKMPDEEYGDKYEITIENYNDDIRNGWYEYWSKDLYIRGKRKNDKQVGRWVYITSQNRKMIWQNGRQYRGYRGKMPSVSKELKKSLEIYLPYANPSDIQNPVRNHIYLSDSLNVIDKWVGNHKVSSKSYYTVFSSNNLLSFYDIHFTDRKIQFSPLEFSYYPIEREMNYAIDVGLILSLNYDGTVIQELSLEGEYD